MKCFIDGCINYSETEVNHCGYYRDIRNCKDLKEDLKRINKKDCPNWSMEREEGI